MMIDKNVRSRISQLSYVLLEARHLDRQTSGAFRAWLQRFAEDAVETSLPEVSAIAWAAADLFEKMTADRSSDGDGLSRRTVALMLEEMVEDKIQAASGEGRLCPAGSAARDLRQAV